GRFKNAERSSMGKSRRTKLMPSSQRLERSKRLRERRWLVVRGWWLVEDTRSRADCLNCLIFPPLAGWPSFAFTNHHPPTTNHPLHRPILAKRRQRFLKFRRQRCFGFDGPAQTGMV